VQGQELFFSFHLLNLQSYCRCLITAMVINNHNRMRTKLDLTLLSQDFHYIDTAAKELENARLVAQTYAHIDNCISVLSDMKMRKSYLYYGAAAEQFNLQHRDNEINSIWEDELLGQVQPDDLQKKYRLEYQFFHLLKQLALDERKDYELITKLRIRNKKGKHMLVKHRLIYLGSMDDGNIWLALCLYNLVYEDAGFEVPQGVIINTKTGKVIIYEEEGFEKILSNREKEVLQQIKKGFRSKEIADKMDLSVNTINRHRQNIFRKLNVTNALEACRLAELAGFL
jgi:DNA-binding CsgD family transcriptional regulator